MGTGARDTTGAAEHPGFGFAPFRGWFGGAKRHKPKADWAGVDGGAWIPVLGDLLGNLLLVVLAPFPHGVEDGAHRLAERSE